MLYLLYRSVLLTDYLRTNTSGINGEELNSHADKIRVEFSEELQRRTESKSVTGNKKHQERIILVINQLDAQNLVLK